MAKYKLKLDTLPSLPTFTEASKEELRILLAIIAEKGNVDINLLAKLACVTPARAKASLVLWEEVGVITPDNEMETATITEEFTNSTSYDIADAMTSIECAEMIRDNELASLISELERLMEKSSFSSGEVKLISALYTELTLSEEYILTLAVYMVEAKGRISVKRLADEAERLTKRGIDTAEALEVYFADKEKESGDMQEVKRMLGIYNRALSKKERELITKWFNEYNYSLEIIGEAFDITVINTGKLSLPYMDKLIKHWYENGAKSLNEVRTLVERERSQREYEEKPKTPPRIPRAPKERPRFGDFDANDVFEKVLARSYGNDDDEEDDE